jgi:hypothetical protein
MTALNHMSAAFGAQATTHAAEGLPSRPITLPNDVPSRYPHRTPVRVGAAKRCPSCAAPLDGGPVRFRCEPCGRSVMAADLDTEFHAPRHAPDGAHAAADVADTSEGRAAR